MPGPNILLAKPHISSLQILFFPSLWSLFLTVLIKLASCSLTRDLNMTRLICFEAVITHDVEKYRLIQGWCS